MKRLHQYSQYFLRNPRLVSALIARSSINDSDTVYDIGAGSGIITSQLARIAKKVVAIEFEVRTAELLKRNTSTLDNVEVVAGDVLNIMLPDDGYKIFANIPFHLSSEIIKRLVYESKPEDVYLIVQKQFANKLLPDNNGFSSQLGMQAGVIYDITIIKRLRRTDYWPHPNVDTVVLRMQRRKVPLIEAEHQNRYFAFIEKAFTKPDFFKSAYERKFGQAPSVKASGLRLYDWVKFFSVKSE